MKALSKDALKGQKLSAQGRSTSGRLPPKGRKNALGIWIEGVNAP